MRYSVTFPQRAKAWYRPTAFRPRVERLEDRLPAGSLLSGAITSLLGLLPGQAVSPASALPDAQPGGVAQHRGWPDGVMDGASAAIDFALPSWPEPVEIPVPTAGPLATRELTSHPATPGTDDFLDGQVAASPVPAIARVSAPWAPRSCWNCEAPPVAPPPPSALVVAAGPVAQGNGNTPFNQPALDGTHRRVAEAAVARSAAATVTQAPVRIVPVHNMRETIQTNQCEAGPLATSYSTFLRDHTDRVEGQGITVTADGAAFTAGVVTRKDGSGITDAFVTRVSAAAPFTCMTAIFSCPGTCSALSVKITHAGIDAIYVCFTCCDSMDPPNCYIRQLCMDPVTLNQVATYDIVSMDGTINGCDLTTDSGGNVYGTGWLTDSSGRQSVLVIKSDHNLVPIYQVTVAFLGANATGRAIDVDSDGNAYVGGTYQADGTPGNIEGLSFRLNAAGTMVDWALAWINPVSGDSGAVNGIQVAPNGNVYMTGTLANNNPPPQDHTDLLLAQVHPNNGSLVWVIDWVLMPGGDFSGNSIAVDTAGYSYVATAINGPPDASGRIDIDGELVKFSPAGDTIVDDQRFGNANPDNATPDRALGVALLSTAPNTDVYTTGWTESPDFTPIVNACQPTFSGIRDGFTARLSQPS